MTEYLAGSHVDIIRIGFFDLVDVRLDVLHVVQVFYSSLFTGSDDQSLLAHAQRHLRLARLEVSRLRQFDDFSRAGCKLDLDERFHLGLEWRGRSASAARATACAAGGAVRFLHRQICFYLFETG